MNGVTVLDDVTAAVLWRVYSRLEYSRHGPLDSCDFITQLHFATICDSKNRIKTGLK